MEKNPWFRALIVILVLIGSLYLASQVWMIVSQFTDIIAIFFLAWLVAFVLAPVASALCRLGISRSGTVAIVYIGLLVGIVLAAIVVVPALAFQLTQLGEKLPLYARQLAELVVPVQQNPILTDLNIDISKLYSTQELTAQFRDLGTMLVQNSLAVATGVATFFINGIILLVISFYLALDGERLLGAALDVVPHQWHTDAHYFVDSVGRKFGGFLRGQLIQAMLFGIGVAIVMAVFNLNYLLLVSLVSGLLIFIPFFGPFLGLIPPVLVAVLSTDTTTFLVFVGILLVLQQVVLNVIAPKLMSEAVGIHPVLVFLALLLGIKIAGPLGAIFGVPVMAVLNAMIVQFYHRYEAEQEQNALVSDALATPAAPKSKSDQKPRAKPSAVVGIVGHVSSLTTRWFSRLLRVGK